MRRLARGCLWTYLLAQLAGTAVFANTLVLASDDVRALARVEQLSRWSGEPVDLAAGLCVDLNYAGPWPDSGLSALSPNAESLLVQTWEACRTPMADKRLVAQVRAALQERIAKLGAPHAALARCRAISTGVEELERCMSAAFGRPLDPADRRRLELRQ
jgi:hypothetical protein